MTAVSGCQVCAEIGDRSVAGDPYPAPRLGDEMARRERIRGVLIGGAVGDAIATAIRSGASVELHGGPAPTRTGGATLLAVFTAEGTLRMLIRCHARGIGPTFGVVRHALDRWLFTQGALPDRIRDEWAPADGRWPDGWLATEHTLHGRRSDHPTTVRALRDPLPAEEPYVIGDEPISRPNTSDSAGALVRVAPTAAFIPVGWALEAGIRSAILTHGGSLGMLLPGVLAHILAALMGGADLDVALADAREGLAAWPHSSRALQVIDRAITGVQDTTGSPGAARALHAAILAARGFARAGGDASGLLATVARAHRGSAAIVTGQLIGAMCGDGAFPSRWRRSLDVGAVLEEMADAAAFAHRVLVLDRPVPELAAMDESVEPPIGGFLWERFPGW
jgi:hypothetical protein